MPKLIFFGHEYIDPRFAKVQVKTDIDCVRPRASDVAQCCVVRMAGRFQWGHVITRPSAAADAGPWLTKARPFLLVGEVSAHSHQRPLCHFRYQATRSASRFTVLVGY